MGTKYVENLTGDVMFVGGRMIAPGEGRHFDDAALPPELQDSPVAAAAAADPSVAELVAELLKGNVKAVLAQLEPLTGEALDLVEAIESGAEAPRKGVLEGVRAERLRRSAEQMDADAAQAAFEAAVQAAYQKQLAALMPEQLAALGEVEHAALREQAALDVQAEQA